MLPDYNLNRSLLSLEDRSHSPENQLCTSLTKAATAGTSFVYIILLVTQTKHLNSPVQIY